MTTANSRQTTPGLFLAADTAADLMTPNPVSIRADATVQEIVKLFTEKGISAAPVIDAAGRPVGVVSRTDIVIHDREKVEYLVPVTEPTASARNRSGYQVVNVDRTRAREIMTPAVFSVRPETPAARVVSEMLALLIHRLFVVDDAGVLVGVVSAIDVLRKLRE